MSKKIKENASFKGWNILKFISGRKKMILTIVGSLCGYFAFGQELTGLIIGPVFEGIWSICEYFFKKVKLD